MSTLRPTGELLRTWRERRRLSQLDLAGTLAMFSTTTIFGTPLDVTLAELAIEAFFPADAHTAEVLRQIAGTTRSSPMQ